MRKTIPALTRRSDNAVQIGKPLKKIEKIHTSIAKIQSLRGTTVRVFSGRKFRWTEEAENEAQEAGVEPMELLWNRLSDIVGYYCSQKASGMFTQDRGSEVRDEVVSALDKAESYLSLRTHNDNPERPHYEQRILPRSKRIKLDGPATTHHTRYR